MDRGPKATVVPKFAKYLKNGPPYCTVQMIETKYGKEKGNYKEKDEDEETTKRCREKL